MPPYHRRVPRSRGSAGVRRKLVWATSTFTLQTTAAGVGITPIDLLMGIKAAGVGVVGGTVVRTHFSLNVSSLDTDTSPSLIMGLIVMDKTLVGVNIPPVATDVYADWMMQHFLTPGTAQQAIQEPVNAPTAIIWGKDYDVRSKRRLHEMNDSLFFCLTNVGTQTLTWSYFAKTLLALP